MLPAQFVCRAFTTAGAAAIAPRVCRQQESCCSRPVSFRGETTDYKVFKQVRRQCLPASACLSWHHSHLEPLLNALPVTSSCGCSSATTGDHPCLSIVPEPTMTRPAPLSCAPVLQVFQCHYMRYLYTLFAGQEPRYILDAGKTPSTACDCSH